MSNENLRIYLNDHLAGSVGALELLDRLIENNKEKPIGKFFANLREEVEADQEKLQGLIRRLGLKESPIRKAGAWIMEKLSRAKIRSGDLDNDEMGLFLALEGLVLGISGKGELWKALAAASQDVLPLRGPDYVLLEERAMQQRDRVEAKRLEVVRNVFNQE